MLISTAYPSKYLAAADLQGHTPTVTISHVEMEKLGDEMKPVLYFKGKDRGMVLNKTNANKIKDLFGDDTDDWVGGEITLFETEALFAGKPTPALRVRKAQRKATQPQARAEPPKPPRDLEGGGSRIGEMIDDEIPFEMEWRI